MESNQDNEELCRSSQTGGGSSAVWWMVLLCILGCAGWFAWFVHASGLGVRGSAVELLARAKSALVSAEESETESADEPEPTAGTEVACDAVEVLRTMSTHWVQPGQSTAGKSFKLNNQSKRTLFVSMGDATGKTLLGTVLLMPGDVLVEQALAETTRLAMQTGATWCNRQIGFKDGVTGYLSKPLVATPGITEVVFSDGRESGALAVTTKPPDSPQTQPAVAADKLQQRSSPRSARAAQAQQQLSVPPPKEAAPSPRHLEFHGSQGVVAEMPRGAQAAQRQQAASQQQPSQIPEPEEVRTTELRIQDWRDAPKRDVRLVTSGGRHFLGGQVGGEDVQFEVTLHGYTAISEALATRVGASGCRSGSWYVMGRYWPVCQKLIPRIVFGNIELENVMVVVIPGFGRPVLSTDLIGHARFFQGQDGYYVTIGR